MKKYIAHLRTKQDHHKKRFALGVSAGITAIMAIFWATSFSYFNGGSTNVEIARKNSENSPLNVIRRNVASVYESVTGSKVEFVKEQNPADAPKLEYVPTPAATISQ